MKRIWATFLCAALSLYAAGAESAEVLERFYRENDGKSLRRLPNWVLPEALFCSLSNADIEGDGTNILGRIYALCRDRLDVNVLTWQPRCRLDLSSPYVEERVAEAVRSLRGSGISLVLFVDPRLMREEFLSRWPDDFLHWRQFEVVKPDVDGTARFCANIERLGDHMLYGTKDKYSWWKPGRLVSVRAVKGKDFNTARSVTAEDVSCSEKAVSGTVRGLASDEELVAEVDFPLNEIDPCSPRLLPFMREVVFRYKKIGIDGYCLDEWGFQSPKATAMLQYRAFWHSAHFAREYSRRSGGGNLEKDMLEFALGADAPTVRSAVNAYIRTIYDTCAAIEGDMYVSNKRMFGKDAFVGKHATWWAQLGSASEPLHNGLNWWAAKRDWAQSDENVPVPADTGMMKKFGSPLWLNEGYGFNPRHYVSTLWRYALCGGRMNWHGIVADRRTDYLQRTYSNRIERRYHRIADMFSDDAIRAEEILRLLPLMTRAPVDCPVAHIFGYERFVNWLDSSRGDWGADIAHGLGGYGYYVDAYPANEISAGTFSVKDGRLRIGRQRYEAVVLHNLSAAERVEWKSFAQAHALKTHVFENPKAEDVKAYLDSVGTVKQTPLASTGFWGGKSNRLPLSDGVMNLTDGTRVRIKGGHPDFAGDSIEGEIAVGGITVKYEARGMFAARAESGILSGIAGGEIFRIEAPGMSLSLSKPADIALVKLSDGWHGVWQTGDMSAPIPEELLKLTSKWVKLRGLPEQAKTE